MTTTLEGIRVVSTASNIPGPVAVSLLRDMGAQVVKIEPPSGDPLAAGAPAWYGQLCARIDVRRLDLKSPAGREQLDEVMAGADLLITASRPTSMRRLRLSWPEIHRDHPRLCHIAIVGYAAPRQDVVGHDLTYQAVAGLVSPDAMPRTLVADMAGAQQVVIAALDLLLARERGREAGSTEVALAECARLFAGPLRHGLTSPSGPLGGSFAGYALYPTREGWLAVATLEPHFRTLLARELGVAAEDREALTRALADRTASDWERWAEERGLPIAALRAVELA